MQVKAQRVAVMRQGLGTITAIRRETPNFLLPAGITDGVNPFAVFTEYRITHPAVSRRGNAHQTLALSTGNGHLTTGGNGNFGSIGGQRC